MSPRQAWDTELYEARHSFVWQLGEGVLQLLAPQPNERILDIGSGTGRLTARIAEAGASVVGVDSSPDMVGQARQNYPELSFALQDVTRMAFCEEFDAVFSNAVLHWVLDAAAAANCIAKALKAGGRFVAELGGAGNVQTIQQAIREVVGRYGHEETPRHYFPTIGQYAGILEAQGLEVRLAQLFDRPTPLEGESGMENWIRQFQWFSFDPLSPVDRAQALKETIDLLRPALHRNGKWSADYRRLRIIAYK